MELMEKILEDLPGLDWSMWSPNCRALAEDIVRATPKNLTVL